MPGDAIFEGSIYIPYDLPAGDYQLELAIVDPAAYEPRVKLAIEGINEDGWYPMGNITVSPE